MDIKRSDEKIIKDIEEWNKQERNLFINFDKQTFEYVGIYKLLDELLKKVQETDDTDKIKLYCELYEKLYKLLESKGE